MWLTYKSQLIGADFTPGRILITQKGLLMAQDSYTRVPSDTSPSTGVSKWTKQAVTST